MVIGHRIHSVASFSAKSEFRFAFPGRWAWSTRQLEIQYSSLRSFALRVPADQYKPTWSVFTYVPRVLRRTLSSPISLVYLYLVTLSLFGHKDNSSYLIRSGVTSPDHYSNLNKVKWRTNVHWRAGVILFPI